MEYHQIRSFRPFEATTENTDQDRTVLRLCDGFIAYPLGALCSGPKWESLWGLTTLDAQIAAALSGANATKAHFVKVSRENHTFLVVWSLALSKPLGCFYVTTGTPANFDFTLTDNVTITATAGATYRDKDGSAPWYASRLGPRWYIGNGVDANLQWSAGALSILGPASPPSDLYDNSKVQIPPCTSFVMSETKSIFAAGNASQPKRIWITHPPSREFPWNEGIYSTDTSFIDLNYAEASRITALSAFQNYVTAHTDARPVNVFDVDGTQDGWKCRQAPSAANSSAPCPAALRDTNGMASFYVGADGEIYQDQAIRVGPNDKRAAREQDIATRLGAGSWNLTMLKPVVAGAVHTIYDRTNEMFWVFSCMDGFSGRYGLWCYNERNRAAQGPLSHPNAIVSAAVSGNQDGGSAFVAVITASGEFLFSDLANIGETEEFLNEDPDEELGDDFAELTSQPTPTPGLSFVSMPADRTSIGETLADGIEVGMPLPWGDMEDDVTGAWTKWFKDAYVARLETGYMDFGDANLEKNYLEVVMTWQRHSRAYVGIYAQTEDGRTAGRWKGLVFNKETHTLPINLHGRRIRVRVVAVLFNEKPSLIRDASIGWLPTS
jgi:hypothetical protein